MWHHHTILRIFIFHESTPWYRGPHHTFCILHRTRSPHLPKYRIACSRGRYTRSPYDYRHRTSQIRDACHTVFTHDPTSLNGKKMGHRPGHLNADDPHTIQTCFFDLVRLQMLHFFNFTIRLQSKYRVSASKYTGNRYTFTNGTGGRTVSFYWHLT